jgi:hypothetical protein
MDVETSFLVYILLNFLKFKFSREESIIFLFASSYSVLGSSYSDDELGPAQTP